MARQGLPLRGDGAEVDSNFRQLLLLQAQDNPKLLKWITGGKSDKYISADIQNELLKVMALRISRDIASVLKQTSFFTIMVDKSTDFANKEQVVICLRWVDDNLDAHEEFISIYEVDNISAATLVHSCHQGYAIENEPVSSKSSWAMLRRGSEYERLSDEEARAVFTHCYGHACYRHALNLACSDALKRCKLLQDALDTTYEITKLVKFLPKRQAIFVQEKATTSPTTPGICLLCLTRWTVRADALKSVLDNYSALISTWEQSSEETRDPELKGRLGGVAHQMTKFFFIFGVALGELILRHSDNLSRTLQRGDISASEGQAAAEITLRTLLSHRTADNFASFLEGCEEYGNSSGHIRTINAPQKKNTQEVRNRNK